MELVGFVLSGICGISLKLDVLEFSVVCFASGDLGDWLLKFSSTLLLLSFSIDVVAVALVFADELFGRKNSFVELISSETDGNWVMIFVAYAFDKSICVEKQMLLNEWKLDFALQIMLDSVVRCQIKN